MSHTALNSAIVNYSNMNSAQPNLTMIFLPLYILSIFMVHITVVNIINATYYQNNMPFLLQIVIDIGGSYLFVKKVLLEINNNK